MFFIGFVNDLRKCHDLLITNTYTQISNNEYSFILGEMTIYECDICSRTFSNLGNLKIHITKIHFQDAVNLCNLCNEKLRNKENLKRHILDEHGGKTPFKCPICQRRYRYEWNLNEHMDAIHDKEGGYICNVCDKTFKYISCLSKHISNVHSLITINDKQKCQRKDYQYRCDICEKCYRGRKKLRIHIETVHYGKSFKCVSCSKVFGSEQVLSKHNKLFHAISTKIWNCDLCDKVFTSYCQFWEHTYRSHANTMPYIFCKCKKRFKSQKSFEQHWIEYHQDINLKIHSKSFQCEVCEIAYKSNKALDEHLDSIHPNNNK